MVGSGLYGSVFAHEASRKGYKVLVIEKRNHMGGNCSCEIKEGINIHRYGTHIFHTNNKKVWEYVNCFAEFNAFINAPLANFRGELYNLPFNMNTFYQMWGTRTPEEAQKKIESQREAVRGKKIRNLEDQAISLIGSDIYKKLIQGYTEKQWGTDASKLPAFIINRLPVRFTFDNNYFSDRYQGIPVGGYNRLFENLLEGIHLELNTDFFDHRKKWEAEAKRIVYTGPIDRFYGYEEGRLEYRSLRFEDEVCNCANYQGNAVINYTEKEIPFTRIIEHKHFEGGKQPKTVITREYPQAWKESEEPFYPINNERNTAIYGRYRQRTEKEEQYLFGGRLAEYRYYDMHNVIASALETCSKIL